MKKAAFFFLLLFLIFPFKTKSQSLSFGLYCQGRYQELESLLGKSQDNTENCLSLALLLLEEQQNEKALKIAEECYEKNRHDKDAKK